MRLNSKPRSRVASFLTKIFDGITRSLLFHIWKIDIILQMLPPSFISLVEVKMTFCSARKISSGIDASLQINSPL